VAEIVQGFGEAEIVPVIFGVFEQAPFEHVCPAVQVVFNWDTVAFEQELETVPGLLQVYVL
jgi:hypothetical protein